MASHWSDNTVSDIEGAFKVFFSSIIFIYIALEVTRALYPTFPLSTTSSWTVSLILGLFITFVKFVKGRS